MDDNKRNPEVVRRKKRVENANENLRNRKKRINPRIKKSNRYPVRIKESKRYPVKIKLEDQENSKENVFSANKRKNIKLNIRTTLKIIGVVVGLIIGFFILSIMTFFSKIDNENIIKSNKPDFGENINILVLGLDIGDPNNVENKEIKRTDTIMLINYNVKNKSTQIVSVPRDMKVTYREDIYKINAAYQRGGDARIISDVEEKLKVNINYLVKVDYEAFRGFIDAIGGIDMEIERDMFYDDEGQNLHINFKKGDYEHLDGKKAEEFFRWRKNNDGTGFVNGDLDRINSQHNFMKKVMEKCTKPSIIFKSRKIANVIGENMETNITPMEMIKYGMNIFLSKDKGFQMSTVQGDPKMIGGQAYLVFNESNNSELIKSLNSKETSEEISKENLKIIILNGTDINGLASQVRTNLLVQGYKNVGVDNTDKTEKSVIYTDIKEVRKNIKELLINIDKTDNKYEKNEYSNYDVVIILGENYRK